jgi:hypothetical protein
MRPSLLLPLTLFLVAACPSRKAAAPADAGPAVTHADALTCATIQSCVERCPLGAALDPCARACVARLTPAARPFYDRLQACVAPACANRDGGSAPCLDPGSMGCKLCAMSHCSSLASTCLLH